MSSGKTPTKNDKKGKYWLFFFIVDEYNTWSHCRIVINSVNWTALMTHFSGDEHTHELYIWHATWRASALWSHAVISWHLCRYQHLGHLRCRRRDEELVFFVCIILCEFAKFLGGLQTVSWQRTRRVQLRGWQRRWWAENQLGRI